MQPPSPPPDRVPCVWVVASHRELGNEHGRPQAYTVVDEGGSDALLALGLQPVSFPRVPADRLGDLLAGVDGVLLGGSATNVHPRHWGEPPLPAADLAVQPPLYDETRDAVALALVRLALARRVPLIGICRGSHEFNVALGGSLHPSLQQRRGPVTHWEDPQDPMELQYAERHAVACVPGGQLEQLAGCRRFAVSSLHSQGACRLGQGLIAEAHADDGLVEAFRWHDAAHPFAWGFQFHPEWGHQAHPRYARIMGAFVDACWRRLRDRYEKNSCSPRQEAG